MSNPSNSTPGPSSTPKAIGSLAKKQDDVTRQGTQKLKFTPTLPVRRKMPEGEVKQETSSPMSSPSRGARGKGRGRGRGGEGRGGAPPARSEPELIASGPFALGPAMAGKTVRRAGPRSNFAPVVPLSSGSASLGAGLTKTTAPSLKKEPAEDAVGLIPAEKDEDAYSDPDEGVEIVDMDDVRRMDWLAPESLRKDNGRANEAKLKREKSKMRANFKAGNRSTIDDSAHLGQLDSRKALDLSESEDEDSVEDLIDDFAFQDDQIDDDSSVRPERLYFFQFPHPFPTFLPGANPETSTANVDTKGKETNDLENEKSKKVTFSDDTKPASGSTPATTPAPENATDSETKLDGIIGRLEIYQSGTAKMRLGNGIILDVNVATQPSFLQHAVHLDMENKRLNILGEVNRRFVISPNINSLLEKLEETEHERTMDVDVVAPESKGSTPG
ncbi:hypothetical protein BD410DRAFT_787071 [Rickenella mellea]|uniref:RNA polymerase III RPC4-domain-containing protein n=1 Tax=Rickenella mellea TaxID=50990 RepID=A0A4Y7Q906_9AGAM|nr:hypothetical protein BD410DRAFT_787071 [Rickenella mellea]